MPPPGPRPGPLAARPRLAASRPAGEAMAVEDDQAVPFLDVADQAFSSGRRRCAGPGRPAGTPGTSYGLAVLRHDQAARLIRHPEVAAAEQAVARPSRRHLRAICRLVGELGAQQGGRGTPAAAPTTELRALPADHRPVAAGPRAGAPPAWPRHARSARFPIAQNTALPVAASPSRTDLKIAQAVRQVPGSSGRGTAGHKLPDHADSGCPADRPGRLFTIFPAGNRRSLILAG